MSQLRAIQHYYVYTQKEQNVLIPQCGTLTWLRNLAFPLKKHKHNSAHLVQQSAASKSDEVLNRV